MAYTGSCLCGGLRFQIEGELEPIQLCHCQQCRKAQGGPFAAVIPVATSAFRFVAGEHLLRSYESSPGKLRCFCGNCGSPVYSRRRSLPGIVRVRAGLINEPLKVKPVWHAYTGSKCNWWPIEDGLAQYEKAHVHRGDATGKPGAAAASSILPSPGLAPASVPPQPERRSPRRHHR